MARPLDRGIVTVLGGGRPVQVVVSGVPDFVGLEAKWRDLEARSNASFFQSWTWTGCLAEERFSDPILVEAHLNGRTVALALFNRRGGTLHLGESGDKALDAVFIEFNGVLSEVGREAEMTEVCLRAARSAPGVRRFAAPIIGLRRRLVLSGVDAAAVAATRRIGPVHSVRERLAHSVDFAACNGGYLQRRSANTRHQLRRSDRCYAASGDITVERAGCVAQAHEFLDRLAALHQASWVTRGHPGAFANPFFLRFHRALIARGFGRGEIDLLHVAAGVQTIGFLYNLRYRGGSLAYQSGFDLAGAGRHGKPGLTCHHQAIQAAERWGAARYEFLAGDDRYKRSLADRAETLSWIEVTGPYSPRLLLQRLRDCWSGVRH